MNWRQIYSRPGINKVSLHEPSQMFSFHPHKETSFVPDIVFSDSRTRPTITAPIRASLSQSSPVLEIWYRSTQYFRTRAVQNCLGMADEKSCVRPADTNVEKQLAISSGVRLFLYYVRWIVWRENLIMKATLAKQSSKLGSILLFAQKVLFYWRLRDILPETSVLSRWNAWSFGWRI